jgi:hypothetical protein
MLNLLPSLEQTAADDTAAARGIPTTLQELETAAAALRTARGVATCLVGVISAAARSMLSDNTKLRKLPDGSAVINAGVTLAPSKRSGILNVCPFATAGCIAACVLWFAGRTVTATVRKAAIARTKLWAFFPEVFYERLHRALGALERRARKLGVRAFCRLNVASDIDHPLDVVTDHPAITFYDYSKSVDRCDRYARGEMPANYHCSYSLSEKSTFDDVSRLLDAGVNVVIVFHSHYFGPRHRYGVLPAAVTFTAGPDGMIGPTVPVVDGDVHDLRVPEFDGRGVVVGLRLKGGTVAKSRALAHGFARTWSAAAEKEYRVGELVREGLAVVELK